MAVPYRLLEHTADMKVEVYGRDLAELFTNAVVCVFDMVLDRSLVAESTAVPVRLRSDDSRELLLDWLRELLFLFSTRCLAVARVRVGRLTDRELEATVYGEPFDPQRHGFRVEVKNVTYHQYELVQSAAGCRATLVFDV